jgi:hypothetical protein
VKLLDRRPEFDDEMRGKFSAIVFTTGPMTSLSAAAMGTPAASRLGLGPAFDY